MTNPNLTAIGMIVALLTFVCIAYEARLRWIHLGRE